MDAGFLERLMLGNVLEEVKFWCTEQEDKNEKVDSMEAPSSHLLILQIHYRE
jgi:hypothetical protein